MSVQDQLRQLFLLDQQLRGLRARLDTALANQTRQQTRLDRLTIQRNELAEQHKTAQVKAQTFEHQARDVESRITKLREQMNSVRSNKEYSALLIEVNTIKLDKTKLEDQALEVMGQVDGLGSELKEQEEKVAQQSKMVAAAAVEVQAATVEVGTQLEEVQVKRDAAAAELPPAALTMFNRQAHVHDGQAMAPIIEESRKHLEYSCGGCYMSIPAERVSALLRGTDQVTSCTNCGRILFLEPELKSAINSPK